MEFNKSPETTELNQDPSTPESNANNFQIQKTIKIKDSAIRQENEFEINFIPNNEQAQIFPEKKYLNPYQSYFPKFYIKELKNALIGMILSLIIFSIIISVSSYGIYWCVTNTEIVSPWLSLFALPIVGLPMVFTIIQIIRYSSFYQESKTINFKSEKIISLNVQKLYRRLKASYIDICWFGASVYVLALLTMLITCIVSYSFYGAFGDMTRPIQEKNNFAYASIFWSSVAIICAMFLYQIFGILSAYLRYTRIDNFYNFVLIAEEEIKALKKQKNRRNLIMFLTVTAVISFIFFITYKLIKRSRSTNVIIK